ncbi:unnamed protein product [Adineta steineri]|uniref:RRM domain-containing protein n=1 Tax=Adineta steineri TaxID=433720 RepID=A0A814CWE9_9BILA|nr:unnamed protein product [Adineta steineri]
MPTNIIVRNTEDINNNNEKMVVVTGLKDMKMKDGRLIQAATTDNNQSGKKKQIFAVGQSTFVTIRNNNNSNNNNNINFSSNQSTEKLSFTKTITNTSVNRNDDNDNTQTTNTFSSLSNQKVVIKVVNDKYQEAPKPIQISTTTAVPISSHSLYTRQNSPPLIKRLHDVSIQTTPPPSSSRSPIRINSHRRLPSAHIVDEDEHISDRSMNEDFYEPPVKRTSSTSTSTSTTRKPSNTEKEQQSTFTPVSTGSTKRTSTGAPVNSKPTSQTSTTSKPISTTQSQTTPGTVLVTNLVPSVTEEDVFELFGQIGRINEIITLSPGCVQIVFAKREDGEQAVSKYHNRLLDGQFMYVSLQRTAAAAPSPPVNQTPKSSNNIPQPPAKENASSTTQQPSKSNPAPKTTNNTSQPPAEDINNNNEKMVVVTGLKDMKMKDGRLIQAATTDNNQSGKKKQIFAVGQSTFVTIRNNNNSNNNNNINFSSNQSTEKLSFTKTITNTSVNRNDDNDNTQTTNTFSSLSNQKVVIKVVNDKYQEAPKPIQISTTTTAVPTSSHLLYTRHNSPPLIKRLHDVSIQTTPPPSSSRSPIRINSHRRLPSTHIVDEDEHISDRSMNEDFYEPPVKRTTSTSTSTTRKPSNTEKEQQSTFTPVSTGSTKRTSTGAPVNSKPTSQISTTSKPTSTTQSQTIPGTVLVTNLVPSVTEEDVFELFGQIGRINEIITLSPGCVQIVFAKREDGEQAVSKYHNRLLDGQFMYVSLQRTAAAAPAPSPPVNQTPKSSNNIPQPLAKENASSTTQQPSKSNPAPKTTNNTSQPPAKENGSSTNSSSTTAAATNHQPLKFNTTSKTSSKSSLDAAFIRQALFHPSNNSTNPVQFQVKL